MTNKYEGTKTEKNLIEAFVGESKARNKYTYYASVAKKEGYEQMSELFQKTADNEKEHAKIWFKELGLLGNTAENLLEAAGSEMEEWHDMYARMEREAREEGFDELADKFKKIAFIEKKHEERYRRLLENIKTDRVFIKDDVVIWECRNCGHIYVGKAAPDICPVCDHSKSFFEIEGKNY